jgi:hypothetical protein
MWLGTLDPGKARQGEFLREAERWHRYLEALAYMSSRSTSNPNMTRNNLQAASDLKLGSVVSMNLEPYKQSVSAPPLFEDVSVSSDE